jgi:hypothetical protein
MTKHEFETGYAKRSNVTVKWLYEKGYGAVPCDCGEGSCAGWQMVNLRDWAEDQAVLFGRAMGNMTKTVEV